MNKLKRFAKDENGNVTIDWIVLASGIVMLGVAILATLSSGVMRISTDTAEVIDTITVSDEYAYKG
ncbi:Flp family type IVb pilin [Pseudogemmobacter sp. W21_MBD1_M6]|uniref:Flp family type IVb pilin n=1 Tax=Pseudogemmobacter sp. W21_MBD1_M6 TaxID=3240271 RepID=UPI003F9CDAA9